MFISLLLAGESVVIAVLLGTMVKLRSDVRIQRETSQILFRELHDIPESVSNAVKNGPMTLGPAELELKDEWYGHPIDIVGKIREGLPKLDSNHKWESWVTYRGGTPFLHLNLIDITAEKTVVLQEMTPVDLFTFNATNVRHETWKSFYRNYLVNKPNSDIAGRTVIRELCKPILDNAEFEARKLKDNDVEAYDIQG